MYSANEQSQSIRGGQRSDRKEGSAGALTENLGKWKWWCGGQRGFRGEGFEASEGWGSAGGCVRRARASIARGGWNTYGSVRRGGRRERACDALSLRWPALGRSWPSAAAGGG